MNDGIVKVGLLGAFGVFLWFLVKRDFGMDTSAPSPQGALSKADQLTQKVQQLYNPVPTPKPPTSGIVSVAPTPIALAPVTSPTAPQPIPIYSIYSGGYGGSYYSTSYGSRMVQLE